LHHPHDSGPIQPQWAHGDVGLKAHGDVGLKPSAAARSVRRCSNTPDTEPVPRDSRTHTIPDLSSVVPAPHLATTMGHYLIKLRNPWKIFFQKSSGQNPPLVPKGGSLPWDSQRAHYYAIKRKNSVIATNIVNCFYPLRVGLNLGRRKGKEQFHGSNVVHRD